MTSSICLQTINSDLDRKALGNAILGRIQERLRLRSPSLTFQISWCECRSRRSSVTVKDAWNVSFAQRIDVRVRRAAECTSSTIWNASVRIAQVAPLIEAVPPRLYGGTERVVSWLTEALVQAGHEVTLFASGDSVTTARLVAIVPEALRLAGIRDHVPSTLLMLDEVNRRAPDFDIIHFHVELLHCVLFERLAHKCITTLHGRLDLTHLHPVYERFSAMPLVSISDAQRLPMPPGLNWKATIHHGMPADLFQLGPGSGGYLLFLGRITVEKRPDRAIEIAKRAGVPLKIAAKVDPTDEQYFREVIEPMLAHPLIEFVGEVDDPQKQALLSEALALVLPIDWPEPFGLVMIESMATGTPVIAWPEGSVPEILKPGVTGALVRSVDEAAIAVQTIAQLDRRVVRAEFEKRFTAECMSGRYLETYTSLLGCRQPSPTKNNPVPFLTS